MTLEPPDEEPIGPSGQLVLDEEIEKVEGLERGCLRLFEAKGCRRRLSTGPFRRPALVRCDG